MTEEERRKQICDKCYNKNTCGYRCRGLSDKCNYLQDIMQGWDYGEEDTLNSLWKDAQGDELPEYDKPVIVLVPNMGKTFNKFLVGLAIRPNPKPTERNGYPVVYKGGWDIPDVKYWLDAPLPEVE